MPREHIGYCGHGNMPNDREWVGSCCEMAIVYLRAVVGAPPRDTAIEIVWTAPEPAEPPSLALVWNEPRRAAPSDYIEKCEIALKCFEDGIDWEQVAPMSVYRAVRDRAASRLWAWAPECDCSLALTAVLLPSIRRPLMFREYRDLVAQRVAGLILEPKEDMPDPVGSFVEEFDRAGLGNGMSWPGRDNDNDPMRVAGVLIRDNPGFWFHLERLGLIAEFPIEITGDSEAAREAMTDTTLSEWLDHARLITGTLD
jgi:hypothetical protein